MKSILLTGTYNSKNKGDAAMQLSAAQAFQMLYPEARITLHTPFPDLDGSFYPGLDILFCSRRRLFYGSLQVLCALIYRRTGLAGNEEIRRIAEADAVIDLSGDMQTESYGPHVAYSHFLPLLLTLALGRPLMLCAQSIGPFRWTKWLARLIFNRIDLITVRDEISLSYLKEHCLGKNIRLTADMAFLLQPADEARVDEIVQKEALPNDGRRLLGVSISGLIEQHYRKRNPNASTITFHDLMANELDKIVEQLNLDIVFVAHVTGPTTIKDDRVAAGKVLERMRHADRAHILRGDYRPDELKGIIRRFWLHTGARMHASIAAVTSSIPVASIAYSHKTPGVMRQFGLEEAVVDIAEFKEGDLERSLKMLAEVHNEFSERMKDVVNDLKAKAFLNIEMAIKHLDLR